MAFKTGMKYAIVKQIAYSGYKDNDIVIATAEESVSDAEVYHIIRNGEIIHTFEDSEENKYSIIDTLYALKHGTLKTCLPIDVVEVDDPEKVDELFHEHNVSELFKKLSSK